MTRQRDLFPLPFLNCPSAATSACKSRAVRKRVLRKSHWTSWANLGIASLNDLAGRGAVCEGIPNEGQILCTDRIAEAYKALEPPSAEFSPEESLRAILGSSGGYSEESTVAPLQ